MYIFSRNKQREIYNLIWRSEMYIPEFVCGVLATILAEVLASIIYSCVSGKKK